MTRESRLRRETLLLPLLLVYLASLVLAAWPREIRPRALDGVSEGLNAVLAAAWITPGIPVFIGSEHELEALLVGECVVAKGIRADGSALKLHPTGPCPARGLKWKPVVYDHMLLHWMQDIRPGAHASTLWALGDYFCGPSGRRRFTKVALSRELHMVDYQDGHTYVIRRAVGDVECRP